MTLSFFVSPLRHVAASCGGHDTAIISCGSAGGNGVIDLLTVFVNFLAVLVGLAVLIGIVFGAILYSSSGGSADQAKRGIGYIRNALLALVLFIFMYAIVNFLVPGGLF